MNEAFENAMLAKVERQIAALRAKSQRLNAALLGMEILGLKGELKWATAVLGLAEVLGEVPEYVLESLAADELAKQGKNH